MRVDRRTVRILSVVLIVVSLTSIARLESTCFAQKASRDRSAWVGKFVFPRSSSVSLWNEDRETVVKRGMIESFRVVKVDGQWIKLTNPFTTGWGLKTEVVDLDHAVEYFTERIKTSPKDVWFLYARAYVSFYSQGNSDRAIEDYTKAIAIAKERQAYMMRGRVWTKKQEFDKAIADLDKAIELEPTFQLTYADRGDAYLEMKEYDKAIADYNHALKLDGTYAYAYCQRGSAWIRTNQYDRAIADLDKAIRLNPKNVDSIMNRGFARGLKHEFDKAIVDLNVAIRLDPKYANAYLHRAIVWAMMHDYDKAIADADRTIRLAPGYARPLIIRGRILSEQYRYDLAILDFNEAIKLEPLNADLYSSRANAWEGLNRYDTALADFDESIRLDPRIAATYSDRSTVFALQGKFDRAFADAETTIRIDPKSSAGYLARSFIWLIKKDYNRVIADCDDAIKLDPKNWSVYSRRGLAYSLIKQYDKAIVDYDEAIRLDPKIPDLHLSRSVVGLILGKEYAISSARTAVDLSSRYRNIGTYAALIGRFAALRLGKTVEADRFMDDAKSQTKSDTSDWPRPIVKYVTKELNETALLASADDEVKKIEAHCYIGLELESQGKNEAAIEHFRRVVEHGDARVSEFPIPFAELDRLSKPKR